MLFNSYEFILIYLPIVFAGFFWIARSSHRLAGLWLVVASLSFYGYWNPKFVLLLLASITFNYAIGYAIGHARNTGKTKPLFMAAIAANLGLLGYFKYTNFFISTINGISGSGFGMADVVLPLGISFFTFTQIAFLADVYRGIAREYNFIHYLLFVTYFPHLIAGPVLHHKQMMPQFAAPSTYRISSENVAAGLMFFTIGLAKKVLLADSFSEYASPVFDATKGGVQPDFIAAWTGALSYTLQLYFDFSGYSDMAIGISLLFGVKLPLNFNSPYKAHNIIEFWRRWHMTLSQFLRDYLYIPLGGNRHGPLRHHLNLMVTMLLGGLWHGANWTFVVWGGLHGLYLVLNHAIFWVWGKTGTSGVQSTQIARALGTVFTFVLVVIAWVFFRAETFESAILILSGMAAFSQLHNLNFGALTFDGLYGGYMIPADSLSYVLWMLGIGMALVWTAPNSQHLVSKIKFRSETGIFLFIGVLFFWIFVLVAISASRGASEFIYFNF